MNEETKPTVPEKQRRVSVTELLLTATTVLTVVAAVAMTDPKIPAAVGD
ncbi:MAG TPA: hypothetical protein VKJ45_05875 [Blastocatellia bacterium]|nr:hypothetical protein [Blastocatellia bacterium]